MKSEAGERIKDIVAAMLLLAVGIGGFLFINPKGAPVTEGPGGLSWRSLPFIYSGLLIGFTLIYAGISVFGLARALGADRTVADPGSTPAEIRHERLTNIRRLATVICLAAFVATLPLFGFAVTTPLLLFALFYVFGRTSLSQNLVLALVGGIALWVLFVGILKLPLRGNFWDPLTPFLSNFLRSMGL